jgi:hypothetical protein
MEGRFADLATFTDSLDRAYQKSSKRQDSNLFLLITMQTMSFEAMDNCDQSHHWNFLFKIDYL